MAEARIAPGTVDLSDYVTNEILATAIAAIPLPDLSGYVTDAELSSAIAAIPAPDLSPYATNTSLGTHTAKTTTVHGIADTSRLVTIDNIGTYAPAPDLSSLVAKAPATAARNTIQSAADIAGLTVQARAGQTTSLQEWQSSVGSPVAKINAAGQFVGTILAPTTADTSLLEVASTGRRVRTGNGGLDLYASDLNVSGNLDFTSRYGNSTQVKMGSVGSGLPGVAFGTGTDATMYRSGGSTIGVGGLLYVQQGSADEVRLGSGGKVQLYSGLAAALRMELGSVGPAGESGLSIGSGDTRLYRTGPSGWQIDGSGVPTTANLRVKGVSGQSPSLQEWQNSTGVVLANVKANGNAFFAGRINFDSDAGDYHHIGVRPAGSPGSQYLELTSANGIYLNSGNILMGPITADSASVTPTIDTNYSFGASAFRGGRFRAKQLGTVVGQLVFAGTSDDYAAGTYLDLLGDLSVRAGVGGTKVMGLTAAGDFSLPVAGKGVTLKSPDGLTTRTLSIDNTGTLVIN